MPSDTSEKAFQNDIISYLKSNGYHKRKTSNYHKIIQLDIELTLKFIQETQEKEWKKFERLYENKTEQKFLYRLVSEINKKGTINILRNGFKESGCQFKLFYPKPYNKKNPDLFNKFNKNIFSVIDELEYEERENGNRLDLVIFINGLPVITIELKDTFSQGVEKARDQYKLDRYPHEPLFQKCLVHFAMSDEKILMATKLEGKKTRFLPFNIGLENPESKTKNDFKTSYLYQDILQINQLSRLIANFIYLDKDEETGEEKPIFPRYHQLDCVNRLLKEAIPGNNFLIQHSAGSGKTKTIAWLSHGLVNKFNESDNRVYDMVIVVSDRKVIDKQLQKQVQQIEKTKGIVEKIEKGSHQLQEALKSGSNIVVSTIQKFPYILEEIEGLPKRQYAVIIDEAHSSQTGTMARKMKKVLTTNNLDEAELLDAEDLDEIDESLLKEIESYKNLKNISFFAFTATPKSKTLEMFGTKNESGEFYPFHLYSMKQAIEEHFILDVLKYYLTYSTYFELVKKIQEDPEFEENKAKRLLRNFVEKQPAVISKKTRIMLNHFMNSTINKINGKAKAMVITKSRLHVVLYKKEFDKLIENEGYSIKTLVAFTGVVKYQGKEFTENSLNNLPPKKTISNTFKENEYKILIVANKFQTGFDQPLLHTIYADKLLNGITAVQSLSRANRIWPNKNDTLILDFANKTEVIQKAFQPYYETTYLSESTDPHKLYDLEDKLYDYHIFNKNEVEKFVKNYKRNVKQAVLHNMLNPIVLEFKKKSKKDQVEFKKKLKRYQSIYSFLSQLIPFTDINLEKLFIFNKFLYKKLPTINDPLPYQILQDVQLDFYKATNKDKKRIVLTSDGKIPPISDEAGEYHENGTEKLSKIIKDLNDAFGTNFTDADKVFLYSVKFNLLRNDDLMEKIKNNSKQKVKAVFGRYFEKEMGELLNSNIGFYKKIVDNEKLRNELRSALFELIYLDYSKNKKHA